MPGRFARLARIPRDLWRGGDDRHRAQARLNAYAFRVRQRLRRRGKPVVAIGLVDHLGDIVAAEPIARRLRQEHPEATLAWIVRDTFRELIDTNPNIDRTLPVGCLGEWIQVMDCGLFDRIVDLHVPGRDCPKCRLTHPGVGIDHGIDLRNYYHHGNLLTIYCCCGGIEPFDDTPRVYIAPDNRAKVDALDLPEAYVAVHCTSNQDVRDWQTPKWRELVARLNADGLPVVEVGLKPIVESSDPGYRSLCGRLSILDTAEVLRRARVFVGIDSGPAHLANAAGVYGVIILGKYRSYDRYMPYSGRYADGSNAAVLRADGPAASLPVEPVYEAVRARWNQGSKEEPTGRDQRHHSHV
jgi:heptosyltransferase-3